MVEHDFGPCVPRFWWSTQRRREQFEHFDRFVSLFLFLHSRNHLLLILLLFGLLGLIRSLLNLTNLISSIFVHLRVPRVIGTTASIDWSVVYHQLVNSVLNILVPSLWAL